MKITEALSLKRQGLAGMIIVSLRYAPPEHLLHPPTSPAERAGEDSALEWLTKAQAAARLMKKYGFELQMEQILSGTKL